MWLHVSLQNFYNTSKALQGSVAERLRISESCHLFRTIIICWSYHYSHLNMRTVGLREVKW